MCPRNRFGGAEGSNVINSEMTFNQFKIWFPESFLQQLKEIMFCGNLGDPLMAKDCLEIINFGYILFNSSKSLIKRERLFAFLIIC